MEPVLNTQEYLLQLLEGERDRRFTGEGPEAFTAWRDEFLGWLRGLMARGGLPAEPPAAPEMEVISTGEWHGCTRTELHYRNEAFGLTVPATVLQPAEPNGAGVVCQHGHGPFGRLSVIGERRTEAQAEAVTRYQYAYALNLAKAGFTTLAIDLMNFGSRGLERKGGRDHCDMLGIWMDLFGLNLVALQVSDIRHAVSILSEWDGVEGGRIGMAGLSQGGRMTMFTTAMDPRIKAAVSSGACNTCVDRVGLMAGLCGAQTVSGMMPHADHPDVFAAIAPRALQLQWGCDDPLIIAEHAEPGIAHIRMCYDAAGCADRFEVDRFDGGHVFDLEPARVWFEKWL